MPGTLHMFRLDAASGTSSEPQYQANYNTPGNSYAGAFTQEQMERMLRFGLGLTDAEVTHIILEVQRTGRFTLSGVDIPLPEAAMFGLEQTPSDF